MFKSSLAGQKWAMAKVIISICALAYAIYMIYCGVNYIKLTGSQDIGRAITPSDYETLTVGEQVTGSIDHISLEYQNTDDATGVSMNYYLVKSDNNNFITFRTEYGSDCDNIMRNILNGSGETLFFKGYVNELTAKDRSFLSIYAATNNLLLKNHITGDLNDHIMTLAINVTVYDDRSKQNAILGAFVMAALMLFIVFMLMKKPIKDCIYSIKLARGKIQPEVKLTPDEPLEIEKNFDGGANDEGYFYVGYEEQENQDNINNEE